MARRHEVNEETTVRVRAAREWREGDRRVSHAESCPYARSRALAAAVGADYYYRVVQGPVLSKPAARRSRPRGASSATGRCPT